jgi:hypothetical protein
MSQVQQLPTSGIVKSRLGEIELKNGYPTEASVKKIYNPYSPDEAAIFSAFVTVLS